jgi:hypothetical protein
MNETDFFRRSRRALCRAGISALLYLADPRDGQAFWQRIFEDGFSVTSTGTWAYVGETNASGQALIRHDEATERVEAEWDQANLYVGTGDPYTIVASRLGRSLDFLLDDGDTFRLGARLRLAAGSVPDTTEFYQIANFGLYNLSFMGPDRMMSDNGAFPPPGTFVKDGSDFVEFNYFINNRSYGFNPNIQPTIGAHIEGVDGLYTVGSSGDTGFWHNTDMGEDHWLPTETDLFVEVIYYGAATNELARRAHGAIYTDAARTDLLQVNGVAMYYWTQPVPADRHFTLTDFAFFNYAGENWGGPSGCGAGWFDDAYVDRLVPEGELFRAGVEEGRFVAHGAGVSGTVYYLEFCADLAGGVWTTAAVATASGETVAFTNAPAGARGSYRVAR